MRKAARRNRHRGRPRRAILPRRPPHRRRARARARPDLRRSSRRRACAGRAMRTDPGTPSAPGGALDRRRPPTITGAPAMRAVPDVGGRIPAMTRPSVDFPQPDSPTRPTTSPAPIVSETRSSACTVRRSIAPPSAAAIFSPSVSRGTNSFETFSTSTSALKAAPPRRADDGSARRARHDARAPAAVADLGRLAAARAERAAFGKPEQGRRRAGDLRQIAPGSRARRQRFEQAAAVGMARTAQHGGGRSLLDDAARIHHQDAARERGDGREIVADPDQRGAEIAHQAAHLGEDLRLDRHVERGRRLVAHDQRRPMQQRDRDRDALAHAAGELVRIGVEALRRVGNAHRRERLDRSRRAPLGRHALVRLQRKPHLRRDGQHRIEHAHRILKHHRDALAAQRAQRFAVEPDQFLARELRPSPPTIRPGGSIRPRMERPVTLLPEPDSPTRPDHFAGIQVERHAVDRLHDAGAGEEVRGRGPGPRATGSSLQRSSL